MAAGSEKIRDFFEQKTENIAAKVEKTPMEKLFIFFLILISVSAVGLGYLQFKKDIEGPAYTSYLDLKRGQLAQQYQPTVSTTADQLALLKNQDSDLDGLSDYDEIYVYHTSPYLADSDGDGIPDKQEILQGTDPNCPQGQDCSGNNSTAVQGLTSAINAASGANPVSEAELKIITDNQVDLLTGKTTLQKLGIDNPKLQDFIDQLKAVQSQQMQALNPSDKAQTLTNLSQLTPAQLRQELLNQGMDKATLDQIDDQTLEQVFGQVLNTYNQ